MDADRIIGAVKEVGGKAQSAAGQVTGDSKTEFEGRFREAEGHGQNVLGQAKDAVRGAANAASGFVQDTYNTGLDSVGQIQDKVRNGAAAATDFAQERLRTAATAANDFAETAYAQGGRYAEQAQQTLRSTAASATDLAQDAYNNPKHYIRQGTDAVQHQVEENPLTSLLIAGAVGYGLAMLIHGRH